MRRLLSCKDGLPCRRHLYLVQKIEYMACGRYHPPIIFKIQSEDVCCDRCERLLPFGNIPRILSVQGRLNACVVDPGTYATNDGESSVVTSKVVIVYSAYPWLSACPFSLGFQLCSAIYVLFMIPLIEGTIYLSPRHRYILIHAFATTDLILVLILAVFPKYIESVFLWVVASISVLHSRQVSRR